MDTPNNPSAAPAADEDVFVQLAQAKRLIKLGRHLNAESGRGHSRGSWLYELHRLDVPEIVAWSLIHIAQARTTPHSLVKKGFLASARAARAKLRLGPQGQTPAPQAGFARIATVLEMLDGIIIDTIPGGRT